MNILVCIAKTPETTAPINFTDGGSTFDTNGVKYIMNPYDEWYALVRAVELKEKHGGSVTIVNVGPKENDTVIRKGLAIGADKAVRIDGEFESSIAVAKQIADYAKAENFDIIFTGKETIDYNGSETGGMVAEFLDLPYVSYGIHLEMEGNTATIKREIEGGEQTVRLDTPFVVSASKGMAEQRIPNMRGIMMARKKPLQVVAASDYAELSKPVHYEKPAEKTGVKLIDPENMDELVRLLHEEAKVI